MQAQSELDSTMYKPLKRGMSLLQDKQWLQSYDFFNAYTDDAAAVGSPVASTSAELAQFCMIRLSPTPEQTAAVESSTLAEVRCTESSPVHHLLKALSIDKQATSTYPARSLSAQRTLDAQAAGQALAYLMHPAVFAHLMPENLSEEGKQVLFQRAPAMTSLELAPRGYAAGTSPQDKRVSEIKRWQETAAGSDSLTELLGLTGLDGIKREMFSLYDQVNT